MKIDTPAQQTSFKWNRKTHLEMTMLALKDCDISSTVRRQIARYSQMPDFCKKELGFYNNTHFYFPNAKNKSYGLKSDKNNALEMFKERINCAVFCHKETDFLRHTGYAIHYLQDVGVPLHTKENNLIGVLLNYTLHKQFERVGKYNTNKNLNEFINEYTPKETHSISLIDLFKDLADFSSKSEYNINSSNKKDWKAIQKACFNSSVDATTTLFKKLSELRQIFNQ